ncbi:MAG: hypothetical protein V3W10_01450 [candidate division NC10 bacterium]
MIRFTTSEDGKPICEAELKDRVGVYLDNDSLIELANGQESRRQRFIGALRRGGTLLFSWTNAAEIAGPQGASARAVSAFLDSVGPYWVPLELNPWRVVEKEQAGAVERAAVSEHFMEVYFQQRAYDLSPEGSKVLDLSADSFFRLGAVLEWVHEDRDTIRQYARNIDQALRGRLEQLRADYESDPASLNRGLPPIPFDERQPATFVWVHLQRMLVLEARAFQFTDNDGLDFCHAVLAAAYGSLSTLDRQWKRRVEQLPKPNNLARMYYRPEVDDLVAVLESLVSR